MKISIYAPNAKERFETAREDSILHPERIVGNPKVVGTHVLPVLSNFLGPHTQSTPLAVVEIRPTVFSFIGAGGTVTAVGGSQECAVISTTQMETPRLRKMKRLLPCCPLAQKLFSRFPQWR
jgi:hypothetical protein